MKKTLLIISVFVVAAACIYYFSNRNEADIVKEPEKKPAKQKAEQVEVVPIPKTELEQAIEQLALKDGTLGKSKHVSRFAITRVKVYLTGSDRQGYYHKASCKYVKKNSEYVWLETALKRGYKPCRHCNPPRD